MPRSGCAIFIRWPEFSPAKSVARHANYAATGTNSSRTKRAHCGVVRPDSRTGFGLAVGFPSRIGWAAAGSNL